MTPDVVYLDRAAQAREQIPKVIRLMLRLTDRRARELANALGLSEASLSDRLTGKTRITSDELAAAALFFGIDAGLFYRDPDTIRSRMLAGATVNGGEGRYNNSAGHAVSAAA